MAKKRNNPVVYDSRRVCDHKGAKAIDTDGSEYTAEEALYLAACERHRQRAGKRFLTALDYRAVLLSLGYRRE